MKNILLLLLSFVFAQFALAADSTNPCGVAIPPGTKYVYNDFINPPAGVNGYRCAFAPKGTGTAPTLRANSAGMLFYWYCPLPDGTWSAEWAVGTYDVLASGTIVTDGYALATGTTAADSLNAMLKKYVSLPLYDDKMVAVWCPFQAEMVTNTPKGTALVVAVNPADPNTRPAYAVTAGKRATASTARAPTGAVCNCSSLSVVEGSSKYCNFAGGAANIVALCVAPTK